MDISEVIGRIRVAFELHRADDTAVVFHHVFIESIYFNWCEILCFQLIKWDGKHLRWIFDWKRTQFTNYLCLGLSTVDSIWMLHQILIEKPIFQWLVANRTANKSARMFFDAMQMQGIHCVEEFTAYWTLVFAHFGIYISFTTIIKNQTCQSTEKW